MCEIQNHRTYVCIEIWQFIQGLLCLQLGLPLSPADIGCGNHSIIVFAPKTN